MDYSNDINEIVGFINATMDEEKNEYSTCLSRFTKSIDETFLADRAEAIKNDACVNMDLIQALRKLAVICNDKVQDCSRCPVNKYCNAYISNARSEVDDAALKMVDLFCGAGGLSLGFSQEGFITALANDIEACCVDTYAHNHPETSRDHIVQGDIRDVVDHLETLLKNQRIDIVVGGPPCQGFSMANRQRLIDDPRNHLYKNYVEVVKRVKPAFFVMENVKGMLSVAEQVKEDFRSIGYEVECHILNAKDFGVPQNRERLIYIGNRIGVDNSRIFDEIFELSKTIPNHVLGDALYGLRELKASRIKNSTENGT